MNNELSIDNELIVEIETFSNQKLSKLKFKELDYDYSAETSPYLEKLLENGLMLSFLEREKAFKLYDHMYKKALLKGCQIFLTNMELKFIPSKPYETYYDFVIIKSTEIADIFNLIKTEAVNFDLNTEQIIEKIKSWDKYAKIQLTVVDYDRVEGYLSTKPKEARKFANEIYEFAPDVIEQGTQTKKELIRELNEGYFWLWWD